MIVRFFVVALFLAIMIAGCESVQGEVVPTAVALSSTSTSLPPVMTEPAATPIQPVAALPAATATLLENANEFNSPYFGEEEPGSWPVVFSRSMLSMGELHTAPVFTPDGREAYWATWDLGILMTRFENGKWTPPETVSFSTAITDDRDPFLAPSGNRMFFLSKGKLPNSQLPEKENIWYVDRAGAGWGEPQPLPETVNSHELHWQVSVDARGDLYFSSISAGCGDIYISRYLDGQYHTAERLDGSINTDALCEMTPLIAPDASYLIFARFDKADTSQVKLYISYALADGGWSEAVMVQKVHYGLCPILSPDGKFLFFLSSPHTVSWMNTSFIEELRPKG